MILLESYLRTTYNPFLLKNKNNVRPYLRSIYIKNTSPPSLRATKKAPDPPRNKESAFTLPASVLSSSELSGRGDLDFLWGERLERGLKGA